MRASLEIVDLVFDIHGSLFLLLTGSVTAFVLINAMTQQLVRYNGLECERTFSCTKPQADVETLVTRRTVIPVLDIAFMNIGNPPVITPR